MSSKPVTEREKLHMLAVEKSEVTSLKPGRTVYQKRGNVLFQSDTKTALDSIQNRLDNASRKTST
ncbi:hypothetical protein PROFUN_12218 [Planoprotostelium fungivorum]|uniref:Prefoldin subunit 1 n=1 Tax=Planoprotostelium fungivorum TaxID=1890364 RepID=A0A2P6N864_9EUKA|nr:hypothetical protein PROFUN_12218 [Planoprotostelium fungivorum]